MTIHPLPIKVRVAHGESLDSYSRRLAEANFTTPSAIEASLRSARLISRRVKDPLRTEAWRALGDLNEHAFTAVPLRDGARPAQRALCPRCVPGRYAAGLLPQWGNVCLKHRTWIVGPGCHSVAAFPAALTAERRFRRIASSGGVTIDGDLGRVALRSALEGVPAHEISTRTSQFNLPPAAQACAVYPETVLILGLLRSPTFRQKACGPRVQNGDAAEFIRDRLPALLPGAGFSEHSRAAAVLANWSREQRQQARDDMIWEARASRA